MFWDYKFSAQNVSDDWFFLYYRGISKVLTPENCDLFYQNIDDSMRISDFHRNYVCKVWFVLPKCEHHLSD